MKKLILALPLVLVGCAANPDGKTLLETLEFEGDEYGTIRATGEITVGNIPFFSTKVHVDYTKSKDSPNAETVVTGAIE